MSDRDILEAMQRTGSQKRYRPVGNGQAQSVATLDGRRPIQRASLTADQPRVRKTIEYAEPTTRGSRPRPAPQPQAKARTTQAYEQPRPIPDTETDVEIASSLRRRRTDEKVQPTRKLPESRQGFQFHWLVSVGIGMGTMLVLWIVAVQVIVGWTNTFSDPSHYTQTAHLDATTVTVDAQGHKSQVRAFIDTQNHVDMLILPVGGDTSKARVVVGPVASLLADPQKAIITVTAKGSVVTVTVQGPDEANVFVTTRQSSSWIIDLKQPTSNNGGH